MAVTAKWYGRGLRSLGEGQINWGTDTIKAVLLGSGYVLDQDVHEFYSDIVASEVPTGAGYTAGGIAVPGRTAVTYNGTTNRVAFPATTLTWTAPSGQTLTAYSLAVFKWTGVNGTSRLLGHYDFGGPLAATGDTLTVTPDATDGLLYLQAS